MNIDHLLAGNGYQHVAENHGICNDKCNVIRRKRFRDIRITINGDDEDLPVDPITITRFIQEQAAVITEHKHNVEIYDVPTAAQLLTHPIKLGQKFIRYIQTHNIGAHNKRKKMRKDWEEWENQEIYIYNIVMSSLSKVPYLV